MDTPQASDGGRVEYVIDDKQQWVLLPEVFAGAEDFDDWLYRFENVSAINRWNNSEKVLWLSVRLSGKAHVAYQRLPHETRESYKNTIIALRNCFEPACKKEIYKVELNCGTRREDESWADFGDRLMVLADRVFPDFQHKAREQLALDKYLHQLVPQQLHFNVMQHHSKTVSEAVAQMMELEVCLQLSGTVIESLENGDELGYLVQTINDSQTELSRMLQILAQQVEELEHLMAQNLTNKCMNPTSCNQVPGDIKCRRCGESGHYARGCTSNRLPKTAQEGASVANNYPTEDQACSIKPAEPTTISINSVSSYFLDGTVYDSSISFLVDTGPGVSLISWSVWDKLAPNTRPKPSVDDNLVGVDGNPITMKIANLTFQQEFIIAEGITAEGILGLDFLEANKCILNLMKREVTVGSQELLPLSTHPSQKAEKASTVSLVKTLKVPAVSEMEVMGRINTLTKDSVWLVEGNEQASVLVACAAVRPHNSMIPLRLINTSQVPITMYKGAKITIQWK